MSNKMIIILCSWFCVTPDASGVWCNSTCQLSISNLALVGQKGFWSTIFGFSDTNSFAIWRRICWKL